MLYVIILVIILGAVFGSRWRWYQRLTGQRRWGQRSGGVLSADWSTEVIAEKVARQTPDYSLNKSVHRTSAGVRMLSVGLSIVFVVWGYRGVNETLLPESWQQYSVVIELGLLALLIYSVIYVFRFEITLDGHMMQATTGFLGTREFDLRELEDITEDGPYNWKLYFRGRAPVRVLKAVNGSGMLRKTLDDVLKENRRRHA